MRCLGLKNSEHDDRVDKNEAMPVDVHGNSITSTVHSGLNAQEDYQSKDHAPDIKETVCIREEERFSGSPRARKNFGPMTQPMERIAVQEDSWVLQSSGSCKRMALRSGASKKDLACSSKINKNASQSKTITRRPSQMTQEIIKLKEQYEALQSSFKHLNRHLSPPPDTSNNTSKKMTDNGLQHSTPLRPVQENGTGVQAFRPQNYSGTAGKRRPRSNLPSQQSRVRHSFRNTEIIRNKLPTSVNGLCTPAIHESNSLGTRISQHSGIDR